MDIHREKMAQMEGQRSKRTKFSSWSREEFERHGTVDTERARKVMREAKLLDSKFTATRLSSF